MIKGIDISTWQDNSATAKRINFQKAREWGCDFIFIRAANCLTADDDFGYNWANSRCIPFRGVYQFYDFRQSARLQANYLVGLVEDWGELPPVIDVEQPYKWDPEKKAMVPVPFPPSTDWQNSIKTWLSIVEPTCGKKPIIYSNPNCIKYGLKLSSTSWLRDYPLWLAQYNVSKPNPWPWADWTFWQYGTPAIGEQLGMESKDVDVDYFNGDIEALEKFCGVNVTTTPVPDFSNPEISSQFLLKLWKAHPELH